MASGRQTCYIVGTEQEDNGVSDINSNGLRNICNEPHTLDGIITERQKTHTNIQSISIERRDAKRNKNKNVYLSYRRPNQDYGFHILSNLRRQHGIQESGENREETITEQQMHVSSLEDGEINGNDTGTRTKFIYTLPQNISLKTLIVKRVISISLAIAELSINWLILYNTHFPTGVFVSNRMSIMKLLVWISIAIDMLFASLQIVNSIGETIYEATNGMHGFRILHGWKEVVLSVIFGKIPHFMRAIFLMNASGTVIICIAFAVANMMMTTTSTAAA
ncbi:hypothetical protein CHS0354_024979 [Potamilus streckersoni]|uniref:Uncharacterized protein n=1 Tax=Potamilus streckersoni TaxID=2493646 RepID=A0AAE0W5V6_9BIVA|nr:hypothetical protein CHS0354_024979 [Potamilus streckersoni]